MYFVSDRDQVKALHTMALMRGSSPLATRSAIFSANDRTSSREERSRVSIWAFALGLEAIMSESFAELTSEVLRTVARSVYAGYDDRRWSTKPRATEPLAPVIMTVPDMF